MTFWFLEELKHWWRTLKASLSISLDIQALIKVRHLVLLKGIAIISALQRFSIIFSFLIIILLFFNVTMVLVRVPQMPIAVFSITMSFWWEFYKCLCSSWMNQQRLLPASPLIFELNSHSECLVESVPSGVSRHILFNAWCPASLGNSTPCWGTTEQKAKAWPSVTWWAKIWTKGARSTCTCWGLKKDKIRV